jgi:hypothetical protein
MSDSIDPDRFQSGLPKAKTASNGIPEDFIDPDRFQSGLPKAKTASNGIPEDFIDPDRFQSEPAAMMAAPLSEARKRGAVDFSVAEMASNIPQSAYQFGRDMVQPILHPWQTAKAIGNFGMGVAEKAIPGEQVHEQYANQVGEFIMSRYGDMDLFKQAVMQDPVGVLADASMLLTGGGAAGSRLPGMAGKVARGVRTAGAAIDPVNVGLNSARAALGKLPASVPRSIYESSVKWRTVIPTDQRTRMTDTALKHGLPPNDAGLGKMQRTIDAFGSKIDELIEVAQAEVGTGRVTINGDEVLRHLDALKQEVGGFKINSQRNLKQIEGVEMEFRAMLRANGTQQVTPRQLQKLKTDAYKQINFDMSQGSSSYAANRAEQEIARAAKETLEEISPGLKSANRSMRDLLELKPELERAVNRIKNKNIIGISEPIMAVAGAGIAGTPGAVIGGGLGAIKRKSAEIAVYIEKMRKQGVPETFIQNNILPVLLRESGVKAGELEQLLNEPD